MSQLKLGATPAQTVDYTYNERNWLLAINDVASIGADRFAEKVGYNVAESGLTYAQRFNGNIGFTKFYNSGPTEKYIGYHYTYDNAHRLLTAQTLLNSGWTTSNNFRLGTVTYDGAGNISAMQRYGSAGTLMDTFTYNYLAGSNKLNYIADAVGSGTYSGDVDNQGSGNYLYDGNGNVTQDLGSLIYPIGYNIRNLPAQIGIIEPEGSYSYRYNADDLRARVLNNSTGEGKYYINGADGRTEATVDLNNPGLLING